MKKSLVIISFAFIFLLSLSVVSAGFFDWITGKPLSDPVQVQDPIMPPKTNFLDNVFDFFGGGDPVPLDGGDLPLDGGDPVPLDGGDPIIGGGESCELIDIEEAVLYPGDEGENGGVLNNRFIDFSDDEILTIDETFSTLLEDGNTYLVPIPNQECHWEASYESGELYMITVCPPIDEFVE